MKEKPSWIIVTMVLMGVVTVFVGAVFLNSFELSGDVTLDYFRFILPFFAILIGTMSIATPFIWMTRSKEDKK